MASRLNVAPLFRGVLTGLRHRDEDPTKEVADKTTRFILFGVPILAGASIVAFRVEVSAPDQLLAGVTLLAGALLTGFSQVAAWRERILQRDEQARTRALDEAAAHILFSLLASTLVTALVVALTIVPDLCLPSWLDLLCVILGALAVAALVYVGISIVIVANLLWDAFSSEKVDAQVEAAKELADEPEGD
ncbi:MAG: hypothetical protein IE923_08215 [Micrococcales bacterium]|nr:hypothetical protein [Micrococcales bacterium]